MGDPIALDGPVGLRFRTQNVANTNIDQQRVIYLLASIPSSEGGMGDEWAVQPLAGPDRQCPKHVADAIWKFQSFWKARGVFRHIDGVVDPGMNTLRQMNKLAGNAVPPGPAPNAPDPKTSAEGAKPLAAALVADAVGAILQYALSAMNGFDMPRSPLIRTALETHFRFGTDGGGRAENDLLDVILANYREVQGVFQNSGTIWRSATESEWKADTGKTDPAGMDPAYAVHRSYIKFTPAFRPWDPDRRQGQGPQSAAAILIHESIHYVDRGAPDFAYEWQPNYEFLTIDEAIHNPSSYASFAAHIRRGFDRPRPGAGNPSL
ncbi:hypothetical protein [Prosthecomicrobium sp. N25]|uniref:hypothetical protein n=1 Tax=Prosthecomicrobium sp. N25 TaxID=3129254 RepID=UPI0030769C47